MPRWIWFMPFGVLVVALAVWGFRLGWIVATISETDVIEGYTARYLTDHAPEARATDCTAKPGARDPVWIVVTCVTARDQRVEYPVDRMGRLLDAAQLGQQSDAPRT